MFNIYPSQDHRTLLHVKCQPLDFDSSQLHVVGISQPQQPQPPACPASWRGSALCLCRAQDRPLGGCPGPEDLSQGASSQGFCWRCWPTPETADIGRQEKPHLQWPSKHQGPCQLLNSILIKSSAQMCPYCSLFPSSPLCILLLSVICPRKLSSVGFINSPL